MTTTLTREAYQTTEMAPDDPMVTALGSYIDAHHKPGSREFALHTLAGLVGADCDLLQSGASSDVLIRRRESIYTLACERLETTSSLDIADSIDQITKALRATGDQASLEVARTLSVIKPIIDPADRAPASITPTLADRLATLPSSSRIVKGLVVTAAAASLAVGIAPNAAAETLGTSKDDQKTVDAAQPQSQPSTEPAQTEIEAFFATAFNNSPESTTTEAPKEPASPPATTETPKEQPSNPAPTPVDEAYYWKQFTHPPEGRAYHRSGNVPYAFENSPEGIEYADKHGYKRIDLDLQVTKDGVVVVTHTKDPLSRDRIWAGFTDTAGKIKDRNIEIKDLTFEEVSRLKHKDGHRIYSLEHMIKVASKTNLSLFLELKTPKLLKSHLPEIAAMLNEVKMEAVIAGITNKEGQLSALSYARELGFWSRKLPSGTWGRPEKKKAAPESKAAPAEPAPEEKTPETPAQPSAATPETPTPPAADQELPPAQDPDTPIPAESLPSSIGDELNALFDDGTNPPADTPPTETPPAGESPSTTPTEPSLEDNAADTQTPPTTGTPVDPATTPPANPETPPPAESTPSAPPVEDELSDIFASDLEKAADEITKALEEGDTDKINEEFDAARKEFGDIGAFFITMDIVDTPASEAQPTPPTEPTPPVEPAPGDKIDDDKDKNDEKDKEDKEKQSAPKYDKLLNLIASWESGGNYNAYFGHGGNNEIKFTSMKVGDVIKWQRKYVANGSPSSAMGKYQFIVGTLKALIKNYGISENEIFDKGLQDKLAIILLKQRGLNSYLKGDLSDKEFAHNLSKEWASLPSVTGDHPNASYYDGDGLNKAHVKVADLLEAVRSVKAKPAGKADDQKPAGDGDLCPTGTDRVEGITEGWTRSGEKKDLTLCAIPGTRVINSSATPHWKNEKYKGTTAVGETRIAVNYKIAKEALKMAQEAKADGVTLTATIGYRSLAEQCSIVIKKHSRPDSCPGWVRPVTGNWSSGEEFSDHMLGRSVDFHGNSIAWMKRNGPRHGFIDNVYRAEGWDQPHFTNKG